MRKYIIQYRRKAVENILLRLFYSFVGLPPLTRYRPMAAKFIVRSARTCHQILTAGPRQTMLHHNLDDFASVSAVDFGAHVPEKKAQKAAPKGQASRQQEARGIWHGGRPLAHFFRIIDAFHAAIQHTTQGPSTQYTSPVILPAL